MKGTLERHTPWARAIFVEQRLWLACYCGFNVNGDATETWNDHLAPTPPDAPDVRGAVRLPPPDESLAGTEYGPLRRKAPTPPDALDVTALARALHRTGLNTTGKRAGDHGKYTSVCICNYDAAALRAALCQAEGDRP